jgi:hypothetical protein
MGKLAIAEEFAAAYELDKFDKLDASESGPEEPKEDGDDEAHEEEHGVLEPEEVPNE